jgi:hypothetical protein
MKAIRDERTHLLTLMALAPESGKNERIGNSPRYKEFCQGLGWLDPSGDGEYGQHALVVVGLTESDVYEVFGEAQASLADLIPVAIKMKDCLLIERTFVDMRNDAAIRFLRDTDSADGLLGYEEVETKTGRMIFKRGDAAWPWFRSRDTVTALIPVADEYLANPSTVLDMLKGLANHKRFEVRPECPEVARVISHDPPLDLILTHPLFKAAGMVVAMMERTRERGDGEGHKGTPDAWYRNIR